MRLNLLHVIHDFLPKHQAGSEIYAFDLCRALQARHHVTVLCAEYDPSRRHGHVAWRLHDGLPVVEIVNNYVCDGFEDTYRPPLVSARLAQVLDAVQPDVLHVHNLLNLSFDLPAAARERGIPVAATIHDYTLVCPSGGQRVHRAESHVCHAVDPDRCARCFPRSAYGTLMTMGRMPTVRRGPGLVQRAAGVARRMFPRAAVRAAGVARRVAPAAVTGTQIRQRLDAARRAFEAVAVAVAPVPATAAEMVRLGFPADRIEVSDYGSQPLPEAAPRRRADGGPVRLGFVGTLAWHKGVHVLLEAARQLPPDGWELHLHGDTGVFPDYVSDLRRLAAGLPVTFAGGFDRHDTARVFAGLDLLVVPSIWPENSPLVIHEAFMSGLPVVGARMGGIPDLLDTDGGGLVYDSASPVELAAVLRGLIEDPGRLGVMGRSVPRVKTIDEDAREWEQRYSGLVAKPPG